MFNELSETYTPEKILHRDKQIEQIKKVFKNFKEFNLSNNILIQGVTGSGKTATINKVIEEEDNNSILIQASITKTAFKTLKAIFDLNYNTNDRLLIEGIKKFKLDKKIIIIDEVNKIKDPNNFFDDLNTFYRETLCPIILISNKRTLIDELPEDARKTLFFDKIDFPSYNSFELYDIIKDRINLMKDKNLPKIPEPSLRYICGIGAKEGSARIVLNITSKCILSNNFSESYITQLLKDIEEEDWRGFIDGLIFIEKKFLVTLLELYPKTKKISNVDIAKKMNNLNPSRISQLITSFENYGLIQSKYENLGRRGGRFRYIKFVSDGLFNKINNIIEF